MTSAQLTLLSALTILAAAGAVAVCYSAIASSLAFAAYNIFQCGAFEAYLGPKVTFDIARGSILLLWACNFTSFALLSIAISGAVTTPSPTVSLAKSAIFSGCFVAAGMLLLHPLSVWSCLSLGPLGAITTYGLSALFRQRASHQPPHMR